MLKMEDNTKSFDEEFTTVNTRHQIMATIQVRSLDPKVLTEEKINEYISKLKQIVKHNFDGHIILKHGEDCPEDSVDVFSLPESKRYSDMQMDMQMGDMDYGFGGEDMDAFEPDEEAAAAAEAAAMEEAEHDNDEL